MLRPGKKAGKGSRHVLCYWSCRRSAATRSSVQRRSTGAAPMAQSSLFLKRYRLSATKETTVCVPIRQTLTQGRSSPKRDGTPRSRKARRHEEHRPLPRRAEPRPRPVPARGLAGSRRLTVRAADGRSFRHAFCARSGLRRMPRGGEGRGAESGARQRSAISVQAPPPFSRRLSVLVGCAALRPAGQRFVLLGDGRVRATAGAGEGVG